MHMARRVAAWVAWAAWTCKPAGASGPPRALTGYGLKESGLSGPLFFWLLQSARRRAQAGGCRRIQPVPSGPDGRVVPSALVAMTQRRLPQDPAVTVRILEGRVASPGLLLDLSELQSSFGELLVVPLDVGDVEHHTLQSARPHGLEPRHQGDGRQAPSGSELDPALARAHGLLAQQLETHDVPIELLGALLIGHRHGNDLEGFDGHR